MPLGRSAARLPCHAKAEDYPRTEAGQFLHQDGRLGPTPQAPRDEDDPHLTEDCLVDVPLGSHLGVPVERLLADRARPERAGERLGSELAAEAEDPDVPPGPAAFPEAEPHERLGGDITGALPHPVRHPLDGITSSVRCERGARHGR